VGVLVVVVMVVEEGSRSEEVSVFIEILGVMFRAVLVEQLIIILVLKTVPIAQSSVVCN
jgi:hypothetical protein